MTDLYDIRQARAEIKQLRGELQEARTALDDARKMNYENEVAGLCAEIATLRNDLTAYQLERDASRRAQRAAEMETVRAMAAHAIEVRALRHDLERAMANHAADLSSPQPEPTK